MTAAAVASSVVVTEPGIYDIDVDDYHADPVPGGSLSSSGARKLLPPSCPAKFRYEQDNPGPSQARHFDLGHAAHKLVLGVGAPLVVIEAANYKTKAAQEQQKAAHLAGHVPLLTHEHDQVQAMAAAIREHPIAGPLFNPEHGTPEVSLFWHDTPTGVMCRARIDWLPHQIEGRRLVVVNSSRVDGEDVHFETAIYDMDTRAVEPLLVLPGKGEGTEEVFGAVVLRDMLVIACGPDGYAVVASEK